MNVGERLEELLEVQAQLDALEDKRRALRSELVQEAIQRWEQDGAAPTWRVPGLGTACLAGVDSTEVVVVDDKAYAEWASLVHPEAATIVLRIPVAALEGARVDLAGLLATALPGVRTKTNLEVDPLLIKSLSKTAVVHDGLLFTEDGAVEGVKVVPKTPYLSVRLAAEAKARAKASLQLAPVQGEREEVEP